MSKLFEAHITIEPVFGDKFNVFEKFAKSYGFKPAKLIMQKNREDTAERSDKDTFCTGHGNTYEALLEQTTGLVRSLKSEGFSVWRYKIEQILLDIKLKPTADVIDQLIVSNDTLKNTIQADSPWYDNCLKVISENEKIIEKELIKRGKQ